MEVATETLLKGLIKKLNITSPNEVLKKSLEYLRLSDMKLQSKTIDNMCRNIICIELAVIFLGRSTFDEEQAVHLSGQSKIKYRRLKRTFQLFLNIDEHQWSIREICTKLSILHLQPTAENVFKQFALAVEQKNLNYNLEHPQYRAMAIYQLMQNEKNDKKLTKTQLMAISQLTRLKWNKLEEIWKSILPVSDITNGVDDTITNQDNNNNQMDNLKTLHTTTNANDCDGKQKNANEKTKHHRETEDYHIWKERILKKAYAELDQITKI